MAEILDPTQINWRSSRKYPWDEWLDGQARRLTRGEDFHCSAATLRTNAAATARRRGIRVRTKVEGDHVTLQAVGS